MLDGQKISKYQEIAEAIFNEFTFGSDCVEINTDYGRKRKVAELKGGFGDISIAKVKDSDYSSFLLEVWYDNADLKGTPFYGSTFYCEFGALLTTEVYVDVHFSEDNWINSPFAGIIVEILQKVCELLQQANKK